MTPNAKSANRLLFPIMLPYLKWTLSTRKMTTQLVTKFKTNHFAIPQTRQSFRIREDALSWQKSMYQLFWFCQIRIWRRKPKWAQKCPWSNSQGWMLQCLVAPLPTAPDSTLGSQNSVFQLFRAGGCVRRLRQLCQCWAPPHFIPHIPSLPRKHARAPEGWSHAMGIHLRSDIWSARHLKMDKFTKCLI